MFGLKKNKPARISLLDGPLSPNDMLEQASSLQVKSPDDLCITPDGTLLLSSGNAILRLDDWDKGEFVQVAEFDHQVSALSCRDDGLIAVGLAGNGLRVITGDGSQVSSWNDLDIYDTDPGALQFTDSGELLVADRGGDGNASHMQELYNEHGNGRILRCTESGEVRILADGLRLPYGVAKSEGQDIVFCESWSARICQISNDTSYNIVLQDAPGYPARINSLTGGGYILSLFSRRDPLIEFVLSEPEFVKRMKAEIDPEYWITPRLAANTDYRVPIQMGAARLFGEIKLWAPSFSYGLIIILDQYFTPIASAQSRANGTRHGITSAVEWQGNLIAVSKGSNELLNVADMEKLI